MDCPVSQIAIYEKANRSDLDLVQAHDTRALSTSCALFQAVRIEEIMTADSTFTSFYLRDVAWDDDIFSRSLLETARRSGRQLAVSVRYNVPST